MKNRPDKNDVMKFPDQKTQEVIETVRSNKRRYAIAVLLVVALAWPVYRLSYRAYLHIMLRTGGRALIFGENFENAVIISQYYSGSEIPAGKKQGAKLRYYLESMDESFIEISEKKARSGKKSLYCRQLEGRFTGQGVYINMPEKKSYLIEFDICPVKNAGNRADVTQSGTGVAVCGEMQFPVGMENNLVSFGADGGILFREETHAGKWTVDRWYHVRIRIDFEDFTYYAYMMLDGVPYREKTLYGFTFLGKLPAPIAGKKYRIWFYADAVPCYFDNIVIH
ncbi:MAG: hypothetical protein ACYS8W_17885 [Planctomycetota bacterium]|jgi:hypothetical protein